MVYIWLKLSLNKSSKLAHFHEYVVNILGLLFLCLQCILFNLRLCLWTILFTLVWILLNVCCCIIPSLLTCELFRRLACDVFMLVCSFQVAYYYRILRDPLIFPLCVRTFMHYTWLSTESHTCSHQFHHTPLYVLLQWNHILKTHCIDNQVIFWMGPLHQTVWGLIETSY